MMSTQMTRPRDHVAIMNPASLIEKILVGKKTIESRWYMARFAPWNRISAGDRVFFKASGGFVMAVAEVSRVLQFEISSENLRDILNEYGEQISFSWSIDEVYAWALKRKYGILVFLENPRPVKLFEVDKSGFGNACAWMCVGDIEVVRKI